jgi:hypothetical protein
MLQDTFQRVKILVAEESAGFQISIPHMSLCPQPIATRLFHPAIATQSFHLAMGAPTFRQAMQLLSQCQHHLRDHTAQLMRTRMTACLEGEQRQHLHSNGIRLWQLPLVRLAKTKTMMSICTVGGEVNQLPAPVTKIRAQDITDVDLCC